MIPILYEANETAFFSYGVGALAEAISCTVEEQLNGIFELTLVYPVNGRRFNDLILSRFIYAKPQHKKDPEPFEIYSITKPLNGKITVKAKHISYRLSLIPVMPFNAGSASQALSNLKEYSAEENPFTFWTDKTTTANMKVNVPSSCRALLGGVEGSVLDVYGGEYEFTGYTVKLYESRGLDRGVTIRYGKNLLDLKQEENIENTVTGICPYYSSDDVTVTLPEKVIESDYADNYPYKRTVPKDFSDKFDDPPTEEQLRSIATSYVNNSLLGIPKVSLTVSFVHLADTEEYKNYALLETVNLGDIVTVIFEKLGVNSRSKVVKTVYDAIKEKYISISLGSVSSNLANTLVSQNIETKQEIRNTKTELSKAVIDATSKITGVDGGYVVLHQDADGNPYEILIMDEPDINTAVNVWRWNKDGLGFSSSGYEGPFPLAITGDGKIVADFIKSGIINGIKIQGTWIVSDNGTDNFKIEIRNGALDVYGESDTSSPIGTIASFGAKQQGIFPLIGLVSKFVGGGVYFAAKNENSDVASYYINNGYNPGGRTEGHIFYGDAYFSTGSVKVSNIGTYKYNSISNQPIASGYTFKDACTIVLPAGTWVITADAQCMQGSVEMYAGIGFNSTTSPEVRTYAPYGSGIRAHGSVSYIISSAAETTAKLMILHYGSETVNFSGHIRAVRIK